MSLKVDKVQLEIIMKSDTARAEIIKLEEQAKSLQKEMNKFKNNPEELAKASSKYDTVKNRISELRQEIGLTGMNMRELQQRQKELNMMMRNMDPRTEKFAEYKKELTQVNARMRELRGSGQAAESAFSKIAGGFNKFGFMVTSLLASITGLSLTFRKLSEDVAKMDDVYSDVMKTTGLTRDEVLELNEAFKKMDTRTSREDLNKIAEAGGRIGVAKEDIIDFTEAMNIANVALGDSFTGGVEEISTKLGKLKNLFSETKDMQIEKAYLSIASSINELGANGAASEQNISEFALRIGSLPEALKPSVAETLALGAAFEESGIEAEISGRAYNIFLKQASTESGKFAQVMGISAKEVENLINTNPMDFFLKFAEGMRGMDATEVAKTLDYLGVNADGANKAIGAAANSTDRFRELITLSNKAFTEGTSVINEYNIKNNNLAAQLDKARKNFKEVSLELGEKLNPILLKSTNATSYLIKLLVELPKWLNRNAVTLATLTVGIAAYTIAVNASIIADKIKILWNDKLVKSFKNLWAVIIKNPYAALAFAIGVVAAVIIDYVRRLNSATELEIARMNIQKKVNEQYDDQAAKIDVLVARIKNENLSNEQRRKAISELKAIIPGYNGMIDEEGKLINHNKAAIDAYLVSLEKQIKLKATQDEWEALIRKKRTQERDLDAAQVQADNYKELSKTTTGFIPAFAAAGARVAKISSDIKETTTAIKALSKELSTSDIPIITNTDTTTTDTTINNPTTPGGPAGNAENKWEAEIKQAEENAKLQEIIFLKMLKNNIINEEQYNIISERLTLDLLNKKKTLLEQYGQDTKDIQKQILESEIKQSDLAGKIKQKGSIGFSVDPLKIDNEALAAGLKAYVQNIEDKKKAEAEFLEWKKQHNQKGMEDTVAVAQYTVDAVNAFHQMEADDLEVQKQRELTAAGNNAEAREQIEQKYAQKQLELKKKQANTDMVVNIAMAIANGALAITKALAELGPIAGPIAAVAIGAGTLFQIASIKKQRDAIMATTLDSSSSSSSSSSSGARVATSQMPVTPQAAEGRWDVIGADDRRTYRNVPYRGIARTGIVSRPTLMGERGDELIIDNPTLRNIRMNAPNLLSEVQRMRVRQRASGKWDTVGVQSENGSPGLTSQLILDENTKTMQEVVMLLRWLRENRIEAYTVLSEFEKKRDLRDKSVRKGSL